VRVLGGVDVFVVGGGKNVDGGSQPEVAGAPRYEFLEKRRGKGHRKDEEGEREGHEGKPRRQNREKPGESRSTILKELITQREEEEKYLPFFLSAQKLHRVFGPAKGCTQ